ncbi:MAG: class I SAM-dependent methyltransferase [Gammaproteobacteria bacterium]|nr:class I SAM-dependent methyltransferase [Gammaproteobacteria bacterium]
MPTARSTLPEPDADALTHSRRLIEFIHAQIAAQGGAISFRDFMQHALYAPGLGYYTAGSHKLGEAGDFITAPESSPLFAQCIANAIQPALLQLNVKNILEVGAGSGIMAAGILQQLQQSDCLPDHYYILELSSDLRARQQQTIAQQLPELVERVSWLDNLPNELSAVVLGNEVLDAMPVNLVQIQNGEVMERFVALEGDRFVWRDQPPTDERLQQRIEEIQNQTGETLPDGYISEINLLAEDWLKSLAQSLQQGLVLLIDYGFPRHEYYHPQRSTGTLMCHYRHHSHDDPFCFIGLQDITAHVDFTAIAEAAYEAGFSIDGYTSQGNFLLGSGLAELAQTAEDDVKTQLLVANQIKKLTLPHEMGELFKVIGLSKQLDVPLPGFMLRDMRNYL